MVLQFQRSLGAVWCVFRQNPVPRFAQYFGVVLHQDAVVKDGEVSGRSQFALLEAWRDEDHVIGLPFARRTRRVDQRWILAVDGSATAVGVRPVLVAVEHLQFVPAEQKNAAVAPLLALAAGWLGRGEFQVELNVVKLVLGENVAAARLAHDGPVLNVPGRRLAVHCPPLGKILSIEQNADVGGGFARCLRRADRAGGDNFWLRTVRIVHVPFPAGQHGRVLVTDRGVLRPLQHADGAA